MNMQNIQSATRERQELSRLAIVAATGSCICTQRPLLYIAVIYLDSGYDISIQRDVGYIQFLCVRNFIGAYSLDHHQ